MTERERRPALSGLRLCKDKDCVLPPTHVGEDAARLGRWHRNAEGHDYPHAVRGPDFCARSGGEP